MPARTSANLCFPFSKQMVTIAASRDSLHHGSALFAASHLLWLHAHREWREPVRTHYRPRGSLLTGKSKMQLSGFIRSAWERWFPWSQLYPVCLLSVFPTYHTSLGKDGTQQANYHGGQPESHSFDFAQGDKRCLSVMVKRPPFLSPRRLLLILFSL